MKLLSTAIILTMTLLIGCSDTEPLAVDVFRGNPIGGDLTGVLGVEDSPYLAVDTLRVPAGQELVIEPGVEIRFDQLTVDGQQKALPLEVYGKITAHGTPEAPITFTSGLEFPDRGDWEGIWMIDADPASSFEYCRFLYGAKYGRRYHYRTVGEQLDSTLFEYGCLTLFRSSPTVKRCWFLAAGFHGLHCDSMSSPTVEHSVFYDNAGNGAYVHWTADPLFRYNIVIENDDYGVFFREGGENPENRDDARVDYNIVWSNFSGEFNQQAPLGMGRVSTTNENLDSCDYRYNLRLNPEFNWDFRLNSCSAAIDAGPPDAALKDPDGTRSELGIFSYDYRPGEIRRRITVDRLESINQPYFMSCDVLLPKGQTLNIDPGVRILVEGRFEFRVRGKLMAEGTAGSPIDIVSARENPSKGDWIGLVFPAGSDDGSVLEYTNIANARWGVRLSQQEIIISNCTITNSDSVGVMCDNFASPTIVDCELSNNSVAGILCQFNSSPVIRRNHIHGGAGYGIFARESCEPEITNNLIENVATDGIRLDNLSKAVIVNNTIVECGYFGLLCFNNSSPDVINNIFFSNGTPARGGMGITAHRTSLPKIEYNAFWDHPVRDVSISANQSAFREDMNVLEDPKFVDAANGDYRLTAGSPCVDTGDPALNDPDGSRSDMGAYGGPFAR